MLVAHHVDAAPALAAHRLERLQRERAQGLLVGVVEARRAQVLGAVGLVLGLEVIKRVGRLQADRRQRASVDDRHGVLRAAHPGFHQHVAVVGAGVFQGFVQFRRAVHLGHADGGALVGRLHHQREADITVVQAGHVERRRGQAGALPQLFGAHLVHADGGRHHAGAGVRQFQMLQQPLDHAVFAAPPVQGDKGHVEALEGVHAALRRVHQLGDQAQLTQRLVHRRAALQGHGALRGIAAGEHRHPADAGQALLHFAGQRHAGRLAAIDHGRLRGRRWVRCAPPVRGRYRPRCRRPG